MIPQELKELDRWVCCTDDSKIPYKAWVFDTASSVKPDTWSDFAMADEAVREGNYKYLGFVFKESDGYVGIDIDTGYEDGLISEVACDIISHSKSYCERSKSGRGFHIILKGTLPFNGRNNRSGIEIYKTARFFIMTGNTLLYDTICENQTAIDYVVDKYFQDTERTVTFSDKTYSPIWDNPFSCGKFKLRPHYPEIPKGSRNVSLLSVAGQLLRSEYTQTDILRELRYINQVACKPPLKESELKAITHSILKYKDR